MDALLLHEFHERQHASFLEVGGKELVAHYGEPLAEYALLRQSAGILDLSFRGRLCLVGADRVKFLNGQVTNNVKDLKPGQGCYAALISAKGKIQSDLYIFPLENEILLDFEPGLETTVKVRLEKFIIADDVQMVEAAPHYGLLSIQGPKSAVVVESLQLGLNVPSQPLHVASTNHPALGELYLANQPRAGGTGFDLFVPNAALATAAEQLLAAAKSLGGGRVGWEALETARIEAGLPRFGADMDETNLPPEAGLDERAVSYTKGCYIGQEVIARIRTYGQVAKALRGLRLSDGLKTLPAKGDKLFRDGKEVGYITSATASPALKANIALAYVRREANQIGTELELQSAAGPAKALVVPLPFA